MSAAHTPGPWHIGGKSTVPIIYGPDGFAVADATVFHGSFKERETEANASLIAAAPDLLEELEQQADGCSTIISLLSGQKSAAAHSLVAMLRFQEVSARTAIDKALGRTPNEIGEEG